MRARKCSHGIARCVTSRERKLHDVELNSAFFSKLHFDLAVKGIHFTKQSINLRGATQKKNNKTTIGKRIFSLHQIWPVWRRKNHRIIFFRLLSHTGHLIFFLPPIYTTTSYDVTKMKFEFFFCFKCEILDFGHWRPSTKRVTHAPTRSSHIHVSHVKFR